jgi:uncharacterized protein HemX
VLITREQLMALERAAGIQRHDPPRRMPRDVPPSDSDNNLSPAQVALICAVLLLGAMIAASVYYGKQMAAEEFAQQKLAAESATNARLAEQAQQLAAQALTGMQATAGSAINATRPQQSQPAKVMVPTDRRELARQVWQDMQGGAQ